MPRLKNAVPKYSKHRASGQAVVTICGKDHYLGPWKSKASRVEYDRLIGEWLAAGRPTAEAGLQCDITVAEVCRRYKQFAEGYYQKNGEPTDTIFGVKVAARWLREHYGHTRAVDFGPLALKALRARMVESGDSLRYVNDNVARIKRIFKWAAAEELLPASVPQAISMVPGLRKGRGEARETSPIGPVSDQTVDDTLPHLPAVVRDMVKFQRLTGARPAEVCILRPCDVDTSDDVWEYRPESHKTQHHDRDRIILVGPKAQDILRKYLLREDSAFCFSPRDSERNRREEAHSQRKTPLSYGNTVGTNRQRKPKRTAAECYTSDSFRRAVHRGCDKAFPPEGIDAGDVEAVKAWRSAHRWSPNQLRHAAGTDIRREYGLEAAQVCLGHAFADVTQVYAERDLEAARRVMRECG